MSMEDESQPQMFIFIVHSYRDYVEVLGCIPTYISVFIGAAKSFSNCKRSIMFIISLDISDVYTKNFLIILPF